VLEQRSRQADLEVGFDGGVLVLTIDRPERGNALDQPTRDAIAAELSRASDDPAVRSVLLTATGHRAFCSGADLSAATLPPRPAGVPDQIQGEMARVIATGWQVLVSAVLDCEKPVIAAVNGLAAGGGMALVLACDLVVMAEHARLIPVFVRRGLAPDAGSAYLVARLVGRQVAKQLYLLGDDVPSARAHRLGLAGWVVPGTELAATARSLADRLASGPTRALAATKLMINHAADLDRAAALNEEALLQEMVSGTADAAEGLASFRESRRPVFLGY
jgi:2-(1,2-epoxy-1,2-dihydrophenyl)acetyl-CoA isomerase